MTIITSALSKPISAKERKKERERLSSLTQRGCKAFGEFPREINKSNSPITTIPLGTFKS